METQFFLFAGLFDASLLEVMLLFCVYFATLLSIFISKVKFFIQISSIFDFTKVSIISHKIVITFNK